MCGVLGYMFDCSGVCTDDTIGGYVVPDVTGVITDANPLPLAEPNEKHPGSFAPLVEPQ
jgi:hypothetical protein